MLKNITIVMIIGINLIHAENIQAIDKLEKDNQILSLQLESIALKKQIIEMQNFIENDKLKKEKEIRHESAIAKFRNELRASRNRARRTHLSYDAYR